MEDKKFGDLMKELEIHSSLRMPEDEYYAIRIDGRGFSALTERHFQKPADFRFLAIMDKVAREVMEDLDAVYAYTQSDEISFLIPPTSQLFGRRAEKMTTTASGLASAVFSREFIEPVVFDARVIRLQNREVIHDYFHWRSNDGLKNAISTAAYWKLRKEIGASAATAKMKSLGTNERRELLGGSKDFYTSIEGTDLERSRFWYGNTFVWSLYEKEGKNPITGETTKALRRELKAETWLPHNATLDQRIT